MELPLRSWWIQCVQSWPPNNSLPFCRTSPWASRLPSFLLYTAGDRSGHLPVPILHTGITWECWYPTQWLVWPRVMEKEMSVVVREQPEEVELEGVRGSIPHKWSPRLPGHKLGTGRQWWWLWFSWIIIIVVMSTFTCVSGKKSHY